jgi:meso-butanediol dehydrogenase/(S,S)-butanediol dehydrogenase/diacetyl reductase
MRFENKVVLLTGASGGIGLATANLFAAEGARLAVVGRDPQRTTSAADQTGAFMASTADITNPKICSQLVRDVFEKGGGLDVLVNNAGMIVRADTAETTDEQWRQIMAVNLDAPFFLSREAIRVMRRQKQGGAIVHVSSINGVIGRKTLMAYSASKGALIQMTQSMALDCAEDNIRVNAVCPGVTDTPMPFSKHAAPITREEMAERWKQLVPLQRMADPEEIGRAILFLASSDASYITGTNLMVDGGVTSG